MSLATNRRTEKEEIMDESQEIVFETENDDRSDLSPEDLKSILELSSRINMEGSSSFAVGDDDDDGDNLLAKPRSRGGSSKNNVRFLSELSELSEFASTRDEEQKDNGIMSRTLSEVGTHGYGLLGVSVWLLDFGSDKLVPKGWWHNPSMPNSKALGRLFDPSKANYVPQKPVLPGVDLAGILWNESSEYDMAGGGGGGARQSIMDRISFVGRSSDVTPTSNRSSFFDFGGRRGSSTYGTLPRNSTSRRGSAVKLASSIKHRRSSIADLFSSTATKEPEEKIKWRDLKSLVVDPYTAKGPRLALLEEAGFHQAAGVTFSNDICQGIVIYYSANDLDECTLKSMANESYLIQSAQMIGSCISMVKTRRATVGHTIKTGLSQRHSHDTLKESSNTPSNKKCDFVPQRVKILKNKVKGGGLQIPPPPNMDHVAWTMFGTFIGLLGLSSINEYIQYLSAEELFLILGPFGALMTLQYGLTAAPASQPRNAIFGQALTGAVVMAFNYIPESMLPVWIRQVVSPSIAIGLMVKCGFTHPPAGAHAVILSSGKFNWAFYGVGLFSTVLTIIPALLINNLSHKRQYPTYWGFGAPEWAEDLMEMTKETISKIKEKRSETSPGKKLKQLDSSLNNEEIEEDGV